MMPPNMTDIARVYHREPRSKSTNRTAPTMWERFKVRRYSGCSVSGSRKNAHAQTKAANMPHTMNI